MAIRRSAMAARPATPLDRSSYFIFALIIATAVVAGFGPNLNARLLHPPSPRPLILYFHAVVFTSWVILFMLQTALIAAGNVKLHRKVGLLGFALGITLAITGVATALIMTRFFAQPGHPDPAASLATSLNDMLQYSVFFGLAVYWRKKSEFHRRLIFLATCALVGPAIGRMLPVSLNRPIEWVYVGVDALILLGLGRDLIFDKRVHPVYLYGLPAALLGQLIALHLYLSGSALWLAIAHRLIGVHAK
jgi:hypothetical protein